MVLWQLILLIIYIIWSIFSVKTIIKQPKNLFVDRNKDDWARRNTDYITPWTNWWIVISSILLAVVLCIVMINYVPWNLKII